MALQSADRKNQDHGLIPKVNMENHLRSELSKATSLCTNRFGAENLPKVLRLGKTMVSERDNQGISLGVWFAGWPQERIAHIYSSSKHGDVPSLAGRDYRMGHAERRFGHLLQLTKHLAPDGWVPAAEVKSKGGSVRPNHLRDLKNWLRKQLIDSGLVDLIFSTRISSKLDDFIRTFAPDLIHAQTTDLGLMALAINISDRYKIPICIHVLDDYPSVLYKNSFISKWVRLLVESRFDQVLERSKAFITPCDAMALEYRARYKKPFEPIFYGDNWERHMRAEPIRADEPGIVTIAYCGSLYLDRWRGILEVAQAAKTLEAEGRGIRIHVYAPRVPMEAQRSFSRQDNLVVHDIPSHEEVPGILKGADILLLTESFDPTIAAFTRLSLSSKVHLMMASERPVLVHGPAGLGTTEYAREWGWGAIVDSPADGERLRSTIRSLLDNPQESQRLIDQGRRCFQHNHQTTTVIPRFREILCRCANLGYGAEGKNLPSTALK